MSRLVAHDVFASRPTLTLGAPGPLLDLAFGPKASIPSLSKMSFPVESCRAPGESWGGHGGRPSTHSESNLVSEMFVLVVRRWRQTGMSQTALNQFTEHGYCRKINQFTTSVKCRTITQSIDLDLMNMTGGFICTTKPLDLTYLQKRAEGALVNVFNDHGVCTFCFIRCSLLRTEILNSQRQSTIVLSPPMYVCVCVSIEIFYLKVELTAPQF